MFSRFIYQVSEFHSFLGFCNVPLHVYVMFVYSVVDEHLGCFYLLAIVDNAVMNIDVKAYF
jgi:hypothetical protein